MADSAPSMPPIDPKDHFATKADLSKLEATLTWRLVLAVTASTSILFAALRLVE